MHSLSTSFVLGYHGCDEETAARLLNYEPFIKSNNDYDWLGSGIYFWEANPDRARSWAQETASQKAKKNIIVTPAVVGAVIDLGFCLDLITDNGITAVEKAHHDLSEAMNHVGIPLPINSGGEDLKSRKLDCAIINYMHASRARAALPKFDTVKGVFTEGERLYPNAGFRRKTHIQICVTNEAMIKAVFRVPKEQFS